MNKKEIKEDKEMDKKDKDKKVYKNLFVISIMVLIVSLGVSVWSVKDRKEKDLARLEEEERRETERLEKVKDEILNEEDEDKEDKNVRETKEDELEIGEAESDKNKNENLDEGMFFAGDQSDLEAIFNNGKATLVSFGTKTCVYCEELKPILSELRKEYDGEVDILYVDIDKHQDVAMNYPVQLTPATVVVDKNGKPLPVDEDMYSKYGIDGFARNKGEEAEITAFFGFRDKEGIKEIIDDLLL